MKTTEILSALDEGRLSAEEAVLAALKGAGELSALMLRVKRRPVRRRTIRAVKRFPAAVIERALGMVRRRMRGVRTVRSIHWGTHQRLGRRTGETGVIIHVQKKEAPHSLRSARRRLAPRHVSVAYRGRRHVVPVDVQAVGQTATFHIDTANPGDHGEIRVGGRQIGALGAVLAADDGALYAVTAGHVAEAIGNQNANCSDADAGVFSLGHVKCNRLDRGDDIAAIGPVPNVPASAVGAATFARNADNGDVNERVFVLLPESFTPIESHIDGVGVSASFIMETRILSLSGLTSIDRVTRGGDSGAPTLDVNGNIIGFVVGGDATRTYLMPARRALDALQDCL